MPGDFYYEKIAMSLKEIGEVDLSKAKELSIEICKNYNRRRNLVALLKNI